jgi:hypothetical protein
VNGENGRYEIKLVCPAIWTPQVATLVRLHPEGFRVAYPPRRVNSVYLDTFDTDSVNDNLSGSGERDKLRWRWYGTRGMLRSQLELKRKRGTAGFKELCLIETPFDLPERTWPEVFAFLRDHASERFQIWLSRVSCATVINHYEREYYVSWDGQVRLTLDTRQVVYDQRFSSRPNLRYATPLADVVVIELKADVSWARRLSEALNALPFHPYRNSKYVNGYLATSEFLRG